MRGYVGDVLHRKRAYLVNRHRAVTMESPVLGSHLPGPIGELPGRIRVDGSVLCRPRSVAITVDVALDRSNEADVTRSDHTAPFSYRVPRRGIHHELD